MLNGMPIDDIDATLHDDSDNTSNRHGFSMV